MTKSNSFRLSLLDVVEDVLRVRSKYYTYPDKVSRKSIDFLQTYCRELDITSVTVDEEDLLSGALISFLEPLETLKKIDNATKEAKSDFPKKSDKARIALRHYQKIQGRKYDRGIPETKSFTRT